MIRQSAALLLLALAAPTFAQQLQPTPAIAVDPLRRALPAAQYVRRAAANDLFQRQSAQTMLRSSRHPAVRRLAQSIAADHARASADLRISAAKAGVRIDANLSTVEFQQMTGKLNLAPAGPVRDALYLSQQRAVHERSLAMHEDYAKGGDLPTLREAAARIAAIEQGHLDMIKGIDLAAPIPTAAPAPAPVPGALP